MGKTLSKVKRAYIAGFLDADGAIMAVIERHEEKRFKFRVRVTLKISQKDRRVLVWFRSQTKAGRIRKNRGVFDWRVRDQRQVLKILRQIVPFLKSKRKQAMMALQIIERRIELFSDLLETARVADKLASLNVRSKGRRRNFASMIKKAFPVTTDSGLCKAKTG